MRRTELDDEGNSYCKAAMVNKANFSRVFLFFDAPLQTNG